MYKQGGFQHTIGGSIQYSGIGLHSGNNVTIKCLPVEANTGIVFKRIDLPGKPEIKAAPWRVISTKRCTCIGLGEENAPAVFTIEHMMAAFWALGIDNIMVEINGEETPVGDGSALPFYKILQEIGLKKLKKQRRLLVIDEPIWVRRGQMYIVALPYDGFKVSYTLDYNHPVIGTQFFEFDGDNDSFKDEIAGARTFGFKREVEALHKRGLALGGSLDNAVLIDDNSTVNELRYSDEFVRHKILDIIGDMALNGFIEGHIVAIRSGHASHVELARRINDRLKTKGD